MRTIDNDFKAAECFAFFSMPAVVPSPVVLFLDFSISCNRMVSSTCLNHFHRIQVI